MTANPERHGGIELLLVEDNAQDAELTMRALKKCGHNNHLLWVKDGVEALAFIRCTDRFVDRDSNEFPRLILLDLKMPRLNGIDVLRKLKADEQTRMIPVVVMTSSSQDRDLLECYTLGVNAYVTKPIDSAELARSISRIGQFWLLENRVP
jgi:CheY-like chemotaxis protein